MKALFTKDGRRVQAWVVKGPSYAHQTWRSPDVWLLSGEEAKRFGRSTVPMGVTNRTQQRLGLVERDIPDEPEPESTVFWK